MTGEPTISFSYVICQCTYVRTYLWIVGYHPTAKERDWDRQISKVQIRDLGTLNLEIPVTFDQHTWVKGHQLLVVRSVLLPRCVLVCTLWDGSINT